ncbi:MAG: AmmeMemoRadiSam system radical SAM enzyme [Desulfuromonas sp.]|nr:MAG: AmmeMemoRadiSam system radical SAM enzyme [Desulfuromonas sp.]
MHEARFWEKEQGNAVRCKLCRFYCHIAMGKRGLCGVRENRDGILYSRVYGRSVASNVDPIEKKPLFHLLPGSLSYSVATVGCNFSCRHCQNHQIAQWPREKDSIPGENLSPEEIVSQAVKAGCRSIAYTYTEPTIYFEYAYDTAVLAKEAGLKNIFVTNGYTSPEALAAIAPYLDAANVDLKGFSDEFYRQVTGASLQGVLATLKEYKRLGIWTEITTLVIPQHNDDDEQLRGIAYFIAQEMGEATPWHVTAFYPTYKMLDEPPTPVEALARARKIGLDAGLQYVYTGNIPGADGENTLCPKCKKVVVGRHGFRLIDNNLSDNRCRFCMAPIDGIWQ